MLERLRSEREVGDVIRDLKRKSGEKENTLRTTIQNRYDYTNYIITF